MLYRLRLSEFNKDVPHAKKKKLMKILSSKSFKFGVVIIEERARTNLITKERKIFQKYSATEFSLGFYPDILSKHPHFLLYRPFGCRQNPHASVGKSIDVGGVTSHNLSKAHKVSLQSS